MARQSKLRNFPFQNSNMCGVLKLRSPGQEPRPQRKGGGEQCMCTRGIWRTREWPAVLFHAVNMKLQSAMQTPISMSNLSEILQLIGDFLCALFGFSFHCNIASLCAHFITYHIICHSLKFILIYYWQFESNICLVFFSGGQENIVALLFYLKIFIFIDQF